jgi:hypothetical protein
VVSFVGQILTFPTVAGIFSAKAMGIKKKLVISNSKAIAPNTKVVL